jgi:hypothetical protein
MAGPERPRPHFIPVQGVERPLDPITGFLRELTVAMSDLTVTRENLSIKDLAVQRETIGRLALHIVKSAEPPRLAKIKDDFAAQATSEDQSIRTAAEATLQVLRVAEEEKQRLIDEAKRK